MELGGEGIKNHGKKEADFIELHSGPGDHGDGEIYNKLILSCTKMGSPMYGHPRIFPKCKIGPVDRLQICKFVINNKQRHLID